MSIESWNVKLRSYVPSWVFAEDDKAEAIFYAMAAVLDAVDSDFRDHVSETFIDTATEEFLEGFHGPERGKQRMIGEFLSSFRERIKRIQSSSDCPSLKEIIDNKLINGESTIIENDNGEGLFIDVDCFCDNGAIPNDYRYNAFTLIIPNQTPPAETFCDNEHFTENEFFTGSLESSLDLFNLIIDCINDNKAFGVFSRIYERAS